MKKLVFLPLVVMMINYLLFINIQMIQAQNLKNYWIDAETSNQKSQIVSTTLFLKEILNLSEDYELRFYKITSKRIIYPSVDKLGYRHERYNLYYKGILVEYYKKE